MTKPWIITLSLITLAGGLAQAQHIPAGYPTDYKLVWQDNFNASALDPERWNIEVNGSGGGNNELQYYTDREENVRLDDDGTGHGCLILTARRESYLGKAFTSGRVNSKNRIAFTHGIIEAAIKIPHTANGLWPAFWMMGNDYDAVGWPKCGETDILEMGHSNGYNGRQDRLFNGAMHWGQGWPNASYAKDSTWETSLQDGEFHIFTCVWDSNSMAMYLDLDKKPDREPYYKMDIPANDPDDEWLPGNYFHKDNFILFNLAVGGNFPGIHKPEGITALNEENGQQASLMVDYVRIYQRGTGDEHSDFFNPGDDLNDTGVSELAAAENDEPHYYTASGIELSQAPESGLYLERRGNTVRKYIIP